MSGHPVRRRNKRYGILRFRVCTPRVLVIVLLIFCSGQKNASKADDIGIGGEKKDETGIQLVEPMNVYSASPRNQSPKGHMMFNHFDRHRRNEENPEMENPVGGNFIGPILGNFEIAEVPERKKKDCAPSLNSISSKREVGTRQFKRDFFATTEEEVAEKVAGEERQKRNLRDLLPAEGPLPWNCETKFEWKDMGTDHYPRFVRTAECKNKYCFNGFFRCRPRRYKTKVLRRITNTESTSCEDDDVSLPDTLRESWKFITVTIHLCCDCSGRVPDAHVHDANNANSL